MEITDIRVHAVDEAKLKAYVSITLDECFVLHDLKIIEGTTGLFIAMPSRRRRDGTFKDVAHPTNVRTRQWMEKRILEEYERELARSGAAGGAPAAVPVPAAKSRTG